LRGGAGRRELESGTGSFAWSCWGDVQFRVQNAKPAALPAPPRTAVERKVRIMPIVTIWRMKLIAEGERNWKKIWRLWGEVGEVLILRYQAKVEAIGE